MVISKLRKKLHESIIKYGLSSNKTYEASVELDEEIEKYYNNTFMGYFYNVSLEGLKQYIQENSKRPDTHEWNCYAKENNYLSSESMKYIEKVTSVDNKDLSYFNLVKEK